MKSSRKTGPIQSNITKKKCQEVSEYPETMLNTMVNSDVNPTLRSNFIDPEVDELAFELHDTGLKLAKLRHTNSPVPSRLQTKADGLIEQLKELGCRINTHENGVYSIDEDIVSYFFRNRES